MAKSQKKYQCPHCRADAYIELPGGQKANWDTHTDPATGTRCEFSGKKIRFAARFLGR